MRLCFLRPCCWEFRLPFLVLWEAWQQTPRVNVTEKGCHAPCNTRRLPASKLQRVGGQPPSSPCHHLFARFHLTVRGRLEAKASSTSQQEAAEECSIRRGKGPCCLGVVPAPRWLTATSLKGSAHAAALKSFLLS